MLLAFQDGFILFYFHFIILCFGKILLDLGILIYSIYKKIFLFYFNFVSLLILFTNYHWIFYINIILPLCLFAVNIITISIFINFSLACILVIKLIYLIIFVTWLNCVHAKFLFFFLFSISYLIILRFNWLLLLKLILILLRLILLHFLLMIIYQLVFFFFFFQGLIFLLSLRLKMNNCLIRVIRTIIMNFITNLI